MLHRKVTSATIARPLDEVFDWVTTPGYWPEYSPITLAVDAPDPLQPLRAGDRFTEHVRVETWRGRFDWTVDAVERPHRFVLSGVSSGETLESRLAGHDTARIELTLSGDGQSTQFTRDLTYPVAGLAAHVEDLMGFGHALDAACDASLQTMVSILETPWLYGPRPDPAAESFLHEADPLADAAVASLVPESGDCGPLEAFIAGLYRGEPPLEGLPEPMQRFLRETVARPAWACEPRLQAASKVFLDWGVLTAAAHICASLPETYAIPRTARLLNLTRQLDKDPVHADRRLWFTIRMCFDVLTENGLGATGEGLLALQRLRLLHAMVRMFVQRRLETPHRLAGLASGGLWDTENGQPISQLELLQTLLTFSHVVLRSLDVWECGLTPYQRESYIHVWNVAGAMLGIRPELLPRNAADAARIFEEMKRRYAGATPEAEALGGALVNFFTGLLPVVTRTEAQRMMQFVVGSLVSPEIAAINGLETLPALSADVTDKVRDFLHSCDRVCSNVFADAPVARQAAALFVALLMRKASDPYQADSGIFDIPDMLYGRWLGVPAGSA